MVIKLGCISFFLPRIVNNVSIPEVNAKKKKKVKVVSVLKHYAMKMCRNRVKAQCILNFEIGWKADCGRFASGEGKSPQCSLMKG